MAVTQLDGRAFAKFVAAGTYFLRKYRGVLDDLNVFPVPDGDTGSNMFLTARSATAALRAAAWAARVDRRGGCRTRRPARGAREQRRHPVPDAARLRPRGPPPGRDRHVPARPRDARGGRRSARRACQAGRGDDHLRRVRGSRRGVPDRRARARPLPPGERGSAGGERRSRPHARPASGAEGGRRRRCGRRGILLLPRRRAPVHPGGDGAHDRISAPADSRRRRSRGGRSSARTGTARSSSSRTRGSSRSPCATSWRATATRCSSWAMRRRSRCTCTPPIRTPCARSPNGTAP